MNVASCGLGVNSVAMIIECYSRDIPIEVVLFADTGGEKPYTYCYLDIFNSWLLSKGLVQIITVRKAGNCETLEENCLRMRMLPSKAYGGNSSCADKFKIQPQDKFFNNWPPAQEIWKSGEKIIKFIGIDAGEEHRANIKEDKKYIYQYPLVEWNIDRDDCVEIIKNVGLPVPRKSACFFCPSTKAFEVRELYAIYPDLFQRAIAMERNAILTSIKGLGRSFSWKDVVATQEMFPDTYVSDVACACYDG